MRRTTYSTVAGPAARALSSKCIFREAPPRFEAVYDTLKERFGNSVPDRMTVVESTRKGNWFDPRSGTVFIDEETRAVDFDAIVARECAHPCMSALTAGASVMEEFRFVDEGCANIFQYAFVGRKACSLSSGMSG